MEKRRKIIVTAIILVLFSSASYGEAVKIEPAEEVATIVVTAQKKEENMHQPGAH